MDATLATEMLPPWSWPIVAAALQHFVECGRCSVCADLRSLAKEA